MLSLRRAQMDDLDLLVELERVCLPDPWSRGALAAILRESRYLVLICEGGGYLVSWSAAGEAEIERVGVAPPFRGRGWGRALVECALAEFGARRVQSAFLEVRENNAAARALYRRCGFAENGRRRAYYDDGEDAILMRAALQTNGEQPRMTDDA